MEADSTGHYAWPPGLSLYARGTNAYGLDTNWTETDTMQPTKR